jgi:hypothetical protein
MDVVDITKNSMREAFATYAQVHEAASIRRCWSTWNVLCIFLYVLVPEDDEEPEDTDI